MDERLHLAEDLLQEAVYASRAKQAAGVSLLATRQRDGSSPANCGLGREAAVELELSEKGRAAFARLCPSDASPAELERVRAALAAWVERQDQLDRDRNHFLKAFRIKHGLDRGKYTPEQLAAFEDGLARVNAQIAAERRAAAAVVAGATS